LDFRRVRWVAEFLAVRTAAALLRLVPLRTRLALGRSLGRLAFRVDRRHRRVALENLEQAYPGERATWHRQVALGAFEHLGRLFSEILCQGWNTRGALGMARYEGWCHLQQVASSGRGYFLLSGHFGNWERVANLQSALGYPLWMIVRPLDNPLLEGFFARLREGTGNRVIHKRNAVREMVRGLKAGKGIAIVIDQNFGEAARVFAPFFGRPAATTPVLGSLAVRLRAPILPVFSYPEEGGRYRIVYGPPFEAPDTGNPEADAVEVTRRATALIEEAVRACPNAWFWMHRRWRTRPESDLEEASASG
jgi:Kdo2-lipid IVA lauroyltransferase/acyltransferase